MISAQEMARRNPRMNTEGRARVRITKSRPNPVSLTESIGLFDAPEGVFEVYASEVAQLRATTMTDDDVRTLGLARMAFANKLRAEMLTDKARGRGVTPEMVAAHFAHPRESWPQPMRDVEATFGASSVEREFCQLTVGVRTGIPKLASLEVLQEGLPPPGEEEALKQRMAAAEQNAANAEMLAAAIAKAMDGAVNKIIAATGGKRNS